ncbi:MAG TPA: FHA domain-containing protein, partial [Gemmata sp.]|nr:FHA domain-containing protein [Gemmata sp.]
EVNPRHTWLQVISGQVFAVDLGSRTGLGWPDGHTGSGWLPVESPLRVGPFHVRLKSPVSPPKDFIPAGYNPLQSDGGCLRSHPTVSLEFRNGKRARDRWTVNRVVTLVGRAPESKIHLTADDIAGYHCGLVLTPEGLWVVDLSARGVVINGERMRVSPLPDGAELWVGRFLIGVHYAGSSRAVEFATAGVVDSGLQNESTARDSGTTAVVSDLLNSRDAERAGSLAEEPAEDEVPLGLEALAEPNSGLPSSHIMADVFRLWSPGDPEGSNPIAVAGSGGLAVLESARISTSHSSRAGVTPDVLELIAPQPPSTRSNHPSTAHEPDEPVKLLRRLGEAHAQLFTQFQHSLVLMLQLFGCLEPEQHPAIQQELARIQELNAELAELQGEVARRAAEAAVPAESRRRRESDFASPAAASDSLTTPNRSDDATALHDWVIERINNLQRERQSRWQLLVGLVSGKSA